MSNIQVKVRRLERLLDRVMKYHTNKPRDRSETIEDICEDIAAERIKIDSIVAPGFGGVFNDPKFAHLFRGTK